MTSVLESMVVDEKQLPEKPVDREKVCIRHKTITSVIWKFLLSLYL